MAIAEAKIDTPCSAYRGMCEAWGLVDTLDGGTRAMRQAGTRYLPQFPREKNDVYYIRLNGATLYEAYRDTLDSLSAKPFVKDVTIKEADALPESLRDIERNADRDGTPLTAFASEVFRAGAHYGLTHVLIDHPSRIPDLNLSAERELAIRPYFQHIEPTRVIGWTVDRDITGKPTLASVRIKECITEPDGLWGERTVQRVRVFTKTDWALYRQNDKGDDYVEEASGTHGLGVVPLVTFYTNRLAFMEAAPALEALAWLNLQHWQSGSDQTNILRVARFPIIYGRGWKEDAAKNLVIAPNAVLSNSSTDAYLEFVEHQGTAIEAGRKELSDIEARMQIMGLKPLVESSAQSTATGKRIDEQRSQSAIKAWTKTLQRTLERAYQIAALWRNETIPDGFSVDIFDDFAVLSERSFSEMEWLLRACFAGKLSTKTLLAEGKRRSIFDADFDVEDEIEDIAGETSIPEFPEEPNQPDGDDPA